MPLGSRSLALVLGLTLALAASPAFAQYIYLDSNGDGVHTAADVLHGVGPTIIDLWLDTGHNRDGSVTVCQTPVGPSSTPLTMFAYEVSILATGGTLSWSGYTNRIAQFSAIIPTRSEADRFYTGDFSTPGVVTLPPGRYHLGTFTANVLSGAPRLEFVTNLQLSAPPAFVGFTEFGSNCDGTDFANTIMLNTNWSDQDGLVFDAGGMANGPPSLSFIPDLTVPSGGNLAQPLTGVDPDAEPLSFSKVSGPAFATVTTIDPGSGTGQGELRLAPFASDVGTSSASVSVTDGTATDTKGLAITVSRSPNHAPVLFAAPGLTVIAGNVGSRFLSAGDADGDSPHFTLLSAPPYVTLHEVTSRAGGASAVLRAEPGLCDAGTAVARVSVSDGIASTSRDVPLNIVAQTVLPDRLTHLSLLPGSGFGIKAADMNGDGKIDLAISDDGNPRVFILPGNGDGSFGTAATYPIASGSLDLAVADLDGNGAPDVVAANENGGSVSVLLNRGAGALSPAVTYPAGQSTEAIAVADLNRDGILDIVATNLASATVSVMLGNGDGTFRPKRDSPAGANPGALAIADFNLDGRLDVAIGNKAGGSPIIVLPGLGDGSFGNPIPTTFNAFPISVSTADWNSDGVPDLAFTDLRFRRVAVLLGLGDGRFGDPSFLTWPDATPYGTAVDDLNGDGIPDLAVGDSNNANLEVFLGNGNGGFAAPVLAGIGVLPAIGDVNGDGRPDFMMATLGTIYMKFNQFAPLNPAVARAFIPGENKSVTGNGNGDLVILVEPQGGSYTNDQLNFSSVTLSSSGTGSTSLIHSVPAKHTVSADRDQDGVPEIGVTFAKSDIASLFSEVRGRKTVSADLFGTLADGRAFCTDVALNIVGTGHATALAAASFAPNPLNPTSKLSFATTREGYARVRIFDLHGRLVRTLLDTPHLATGPHDLVFDGKTDRGATLSSGVYFYRVESIDGRNEGQIVILK